MSENTASIKDQASSSQLEASKNNNSEIQTAQTEIKEEIKKENPWLTPYKKELYKIAFEKLLIALTLVIAGFFATRLLEEYKSQQSFHAELNKTRIQKIGELWEKVYLFASLDEKLFSRSSNSTFSLIESISGKTQEEIKKMEEERKEKLKNDRQKLANELEELLPKYRFWLSEDNYQAVMEFYYLSQQYNSANAVVAFIRERKKNTGASSFTEAENKVINDLENLHTEVVEARKNILAIRDQILEE